MTLHQDKTIFKEAVQFTADTMGIAAIYAEKDYWLTYALYMVFNSDAGKDTIFKGGTALTKCYNMIDRFSEDIDLVVVRKEGESDNRLKAKLKAIGRTIEAVLPEVEIADITHKRGMNRKTAHTYTKNFAGNYGQVRDVIVVEATWLGYYEPFTTKTLNSFVGNILLENNRQELAQKYGLLPFSLQVLEPVRTICEKIMSLVRFSYSANPVEDLKKKIRHTYDLHQLLKQEEYDSFFNSSAFDTMLLKVAADDRISFKNNNQWLNYHPKEALLFKEPDTIWDQLKVVYNNEFENLVYGNFIGDATILQTLKKIKERLTGINWTIETVPKQEE